MRTIRGRTLILAAVGLLAVAALGGCVTSQGRARYTAHTTHQIEAGAAANNDIAFAFGLEGLGRQDDAVVKVNPK